jgi:hypothetical protein
MTKQKFQTTSACRLIRSISNTAQIICEPTNSPVSSDFKTLATLQPISTDAFSTYIADSEANSSGNLWLVVNSIADLRTPKGHKLSVGDSIKLGRVLFHVIELRYADQQERAPDTVMQEEENVEKSICRICLYDTEEKDNPLVNPCMCSGTMKYIHIQCLQKWVSSNRTIKNTDCTTSYTFKIHNCEVCKQPFKHQISYSGRNFDLFNIWRPSAPYVMLQSEGKDSRGSQSFHIIAGEGALAKLGRGHDCNIRISDISVSRFHAVIKHTDNQFIIEDNSSKFGTLVKLSDPLKLDPYSQVSLQVGRTLINLEVRYKMSDEQINIPADFSDGINTSDDEEMQIGEKSED